MIDGHRIHYVEVGEGLPIVCLHGFPEDHRAMLGCMEPVFTEKDAYHRIYIDLPGMGMSPANPAIRNADDMLDVVISLIRELLGDRHFLLTGQSYGGYLSLGIAFKSSLNIDGLFLLCPCTTARREERILPKRKAVLRGEVQILPQEREAYEDFASYAAVISRETWGRYKEEILPGLACANEEFIKRYQKEGYGFSFEKELRSAFRFEKPSCILTGALDDCVGYEDAYRLMRCFSKCTFVAVDGAGHNSQIEFPDHFSFLFRDWLHRALADGE